jgi:hypothetical protein
MLDSRADGCPVASTSSSYRFRRFNPTVARLPRRPARCIAKPCAAIADTGDLISSVAPIVMPSRAASFRAPARLIANRILSSVGVLA